VPKTRLGLKPERHGAVIDETDLHIGAKAAALNLFEAMSANFN
jgi:hypothetical protein